VRGIKENMGSYDDYDESLIRVQERRKKVEEMKRKRTRKLKRIKIIFAVFVVCVAGVVCAGARFINSTGLDEFSDTSDVSDIKENVENALEAVAEPVSKPLMQYPSTGADYAEIDDDDVVCPYIALLDVDNSKVIAGKESEEKIYPASMTKVMTLVVAVENIKDMNKTYALSSAQIDPLVRAEASRAGFDPNEEVPVTDYLYGLILPSGADAAVALCNIAAGSEEAFVELMNQKCSELGLKNTHFTNSSGLYDDEQYTTPVEMAMIMAYAMTNETCRKVLSTYKYTTTATEKHPEGIALTSTMFGRMYGTEVENVTIMAGKTGYTTEAGNCLVSYAEKNGHRYVAVTAGASNKWDVVYDDFRIYDRYLP
jgi:D-alanyl-D-alanine carboxypeptidase (penicillin-binding protein 5/6)